MSIYRRVFTYFGPFWKPTVIATLLTLLSTALNLLKVWPFAFIVDHFLNSESGQTFQPARILGYDLASWSPPGVILGLCLLMVLFHLLGGTLNYVTTMMFIKVGLQLLLRLRTDLY